MRIIAGEWRGRRLKSLRGRHTRPTTDRVREAWMSALGGDLTGLDVVDLFAGSGALGLEALSRGAARVTLVEIARPAVLTVRANVELLGCADRVTVVQADAMSYLSGSDRRFDLALADPPYGGSHTSELVERFRTRPFADELWVEHRWDESLPEHPGARRRRYGDTALTSLRATDER